MTGIYSAEQIEQLLKCSVCLDRLNQPKILPCQHTFCKTPCIEGLIDWGARKIKCPECRSEHFVSYNGADGFPNNITIGGFLDLQARDGQAHDPSPREEVAEAGAAAAGKRIGLVFWQCLFEWTHMTICGDIDMDPYD